MFMYSNAELTNLAIYNPSSSFMANVLNVAVSTTDRQASRVAAFLQAKDRPMFKGLKSDSTTRNHVCLGRPTGRLQIAAETAR